MSTMSDRSAEHNNHSCSLKNACECYSEQAKKNLGTLKCGSKYDPKASLEGFRKQEIAVAAKKLNFAGRNSGQVRQRTPQRTPRKGPKALPCAPKRFQEPSKRGLATGNLKNLSFHRCTVRNPCFLRAKGTFQASKKNQKLFRDVNWRVLVTKKRQL